MMSKKISGNTKESKPNSPEKNQSTGSDVIKRFEEKVDRAYEKIDAFYHKFHIVVDVLFYACLVFFLSTALLGDAVREVKILLQYPVISKPVLAMDNWILPILAGLALVFDIKDKKIRWPAFFSLFILLLYQNRFEKMIIAQIPHCSTHYLGAACLVVAAAGRKWNRIGWTYVITCSFWMILLTILSLIGVIPDLVFSPELGGRHALGMHYPLNWAAHWFSVALVYGMLVYDMLKKGERSKKLYSLLITQYLFLSGLLTVSFFACRARTSSVLYFVLILVTIVCQMKAFMACKGESDQKIDGTNRDAGRKWLTVFVFSFWFMAVFMIVMTVCYVPPLSTFLNRIPGLDTITSRLAMGRIGLTNPDWFPSKFGVLYQTHTWIGTEPAENYFFIDCSYIMILIQSGVVVFSIMMVYLLWVPYRLLHAKKGYALVLLSMFAVICAMEHHILDLSFDPFLLLGFSVIGSDTASDAVEKLIEPITKRLPKKEAKTESQSE